METLRNEIEAYREHGRTRGLILDCGPLRVRDFFIRMLSRKQHGARSLLHRGGTPTMQGDLAQWMYRNGHDERNWRVVDASGTAAGAGRLATGILRLEAFSLDGVSYETPLVGRQVARRYRLWVHV